MALLDFFTGGKSDAAGDALRRSEQYFGSIHLPTIAELTLPELQEYVEAGIITPTEAEAFLQERNAFDDMDIDQTGTAAQVEALNRLSAIADAGAEGTPMQQAQMANTLSRMRNATGAQRGAIEQEMAARGTPYALIQAALESQTVGQEAQQAHLDAVNAQGVTYQAALDALARGGELGNALQGQANQQANTVAQAANAMQQFNAQNQQHVSEFNALQEQEDNRMNTANRQQVSNNNVGLKNARTQYNAGLPQQVFSNAMEKAKGQAGAATNVGNLYQRQGEQNAGITAGLINLGTSFIPRPGIPTNPNNDQNYAHGGIVDEQDPLHCADGSIVPGEATVPGDSYANDTVPIMASPGEAVIPRSAVAENPDVVDSLIQGEADVVDYKDVATILRAMRAMRVGVC